MYDFMLRAINDRPQNIWTSLVPHIERLTRSPLRGPRQAIMSRKVTVEGGSLACGTLPGNLPGCGAWTSHTRGLGRALLSRTATGGQLPRVPPCTRHGELMVTAL